ncbi:hypothetical protein GGR50DRAFT_58172 [Xylaria sp. CBS 124048]|nr:hypothetical protein GGR50DRAFT_58172 [Xylaria sp. CBS 124048]
MAEVPAADMIGTSVVAAMAGTAAAASHSARATRRGRGPTTAYNGLRPDTNSVDSASYMNSLRSAAPLISSPGGGLSNQGVGVNIHYQSCPYHDPHHADASFLYNYGHALDDDFSQDPYNAECTGAICGCSQCYWRDFLTDDIEKYKKTCEHLRGTYSWNLQQLVRRHYASPNKSRGTKDAELDKLYWYYVGRVREVYDNHCQHHRLLFQDVFLSWRMPEKIELLEKDVEPESREPSPPSRHSSLVLSPVPRRLTPQSRHSSTGLVPPSQGTTPLPRNASGGRWSLDAIRTDSGKGKEPIPRMNSRATDMENSSANDDGLREKSKEVETTASSSTGMVVHEPKQKRLSLQQRLKQLWPAKLREKSSDKADPAQGDEKEDNKHGGDEQKSGV